MKLKISLSKTHRIFGIIHIMLLNNTLYSFSTTLINWYQINKRDLPWRNTQNAYKIWLSEIILQQTRVNQGLSYYNRFLERFPNVKVLATAKEDEVLKLWQGLGYYSRARNIHATAKIIATQYEGRFPTNYKDIIQLKGIGEYTAAAISSFAYNQPYAVVDGNVFRVLSRVFGIETAIDSTSGKKEFNELATALLDKHNPAIYNQAIMEFGALQCIPGQPICENCVLKSNCVAYKLGSVDGLPTKSQKTKQRDRYFNYICIRYGDYTYLQKRTENDVWRNLYEFPLIESEKDLEFSELIKTNSYKVLFSGIDEIELINDCFSVKHVLSHQKIYAKFYTLKINSENKEIKWYVKTFFNKLDNYAVSRLTEIFLNSREINIH